MAKLNQIIAVEKGIKSKVHSSLTEVHQNLQKAALLSGIARTYTPKDDDGDRLPAEATKVQLNASESLRKTKLILTALFDVTATKDYTNCVAKADVVVDGATLLVGAPATYLLFLEKQLTDIHTFVKKLPVLDSSESWNKDASTGVFATAPVETVKTKKVPRNHVKAEATDKHPAQVEVYHEDVIVGTWRTTKFSGALPVSEINAMLERVERLMEAVKFAREEANNALVVEQKVGDAILSYIFG